jgi:enoyl-CoA hydratase/carnithine racemase
MSADGTPVLVREQRGNVLIARLNRPEARNALNGALIGAISDAVLFAEADPEIRVLVLTGTGDRAFCAGMDLADFAASSSGSPGTGGERGQAGTGGDGGGTGLAEGFRRLIDGEVSVPVIGAAQATAVAGGFELLLASDVIVMSSEAQLGLPEVQRGLFPAGGGTFLGTRVPLSLALEIALTGERISAQRGYEIGLVNAVVPPDQVLDTALAFANRIAANGPLGVAATKELVRLGAVDRDRARARQAALMVSVFGSEDAREGALAFIEKRAPIWKGR